MPADSRKQDTTKTQTAGSALASMGWLFTLQCNFIRISGVFLNRVKLNASGSFHSSLHILAQFFLMQVAGRDCTLRRSPNHHHRPTD